MADELDLMGLELDLDVGDSLDLDVYGELDLMGEQQQGRTENYSALRSGVVDFVESATGWGTEADALYRRLVGEADSFEEAHRQALADRDYYEQDNEYANYISSGAGFLAGFLIPGMAFRKVGTVATAAQKAGAAWKAAGIGAVEGAVYGAGHGHTLEERAQSAALGGAIGGSISGVLGKKLIKSEDEIAAAAKKAASKTGRDTHLGGSDGFQNVEQAASPRSVGKTSGLEGKAVERIDNSAIELQDLEESAANSVVTAGRGLKSWMTRHVGSRFAKLSEDAETMSRRGRYDIDLSLGKDPEILAASNLIKSSPKLNEALLRINPSMAEGAGGRLSWDSALKMVDTNEERQALMSLKKYVQKLQLQDPRNLHKGKDGKVHAKLNDFFPTEAKGKIKRAGKAGNVQDYQDPIEALRLYAYDVQDAIQMSARFGVGWEDVAKHATVKMGKDYKNSLVESVILAVKDKAKRDTPEISDAILANMENGLRSQFVAARQGGNSIGSVIRKATSTALLANPFNAVLNVVEGITAPVYQNGVAAWFETIPDALVSTISKNAGANRVGWIDDAMSGHGGQWMGELATSAKKEFTKASNDLSLAGLKLGKDGVNQTVAEGVDTLGAFAYKVSGVDTVNRMGREILGNSAVKRGQKLAAKVLRGDEKADKLLRKHDGMRGLTESEYKQTVAALRKLQKEGKGALSAKESGWVTNFYGSSLNKWQPVSAASLPKTFHDNPNGRMFYSMLSYMNRQMNNIIDDVGLNMQAAVEAGLNTKEGQELLKEAYKNGAKYMGLFGVLAGTWNTARMGLDPSKDKPFKEVFSVEGMGEAAVSELVSNMTMGIINTRSHQYGAKPGSIESMIPAPLSAAGGLLSGGLESAVEGDPEAILKAAQNYVPGVSNLDRFYRLGTGNRLLTNDGTGVGYLTDPLKAVGIDSKPASLFEDLGLE